METKLASGLEVPHFCLISLLEAGVQGCGKEWCMPRVALLELRGLRKGVWKIMAGVWSLMSCPLRCGMLSASREKRKEQEGKGWVWGEGVDQWVKCLVCNHEGQSPDLRTHVKSV